ncbi:uncharacterized protein LOC127798221 [Diospyros lotus]|uniref:uncharacterized protein LOC127798221 n=1 Tax=Diospyros lotus TaxID=55363 RepID=UPI002254F9F5|nr:uncharacterized protein LOC127798221 [Diospyros lotus]
MALILFLAFSIFLQGALGDIVCEELPAGICSFSISTSGKRCSLETYNSIEASVVEYQCKTSAVAAKSMPPEWIENDECVNACGVDRFSVGISSDSLLEPGFVAKLCAPACYQNCPNIVDLYFNLALAEGVFLPSLCKAQETNPRRAMGQLLSSGAASGPLSAAAASGPVSAMASAPAPS